MASETARALEAILMVADPLVDRFSAMEGWRRQYEDGVVVVFVRG